MFSRADIGVIGLAVMGQNLILNLNDHGYIVCAFNRSPEKVKEFMKNEAKHTDVSFDQWHLANVIKTLSLITHEP